MHQNIVIVSDGCQWDAEYFLRKLARIGHRLLSCCDGGDRDLEAAGQIQNVLVGYRDAIEQSLRPDHGSGPVNFTADEKAQNECLHGLQTAINILTERRCGQLIPEVQSNLVYAEAGAEKESQVAGFPGRIIRFRDGVRVLANPEFGASQHIAHIVLTVLKHDSSHRSAMNIKYSEKIIDVCRRIGFVIESFDRADEPAANKNKEGFSLEWGVNSVLLHARMIPDIIYDGGGWGKEPMVRVLGRNPVEVVHKVLTILKHL